MSIIEDSEINILSLPNDIKRRDFMRFKLDNIGIKNYSFLNAIKGKDREKLYALYLKHAHSHGKKIVYGGINALGCFLSYKKFFLQKTCNRSQIIFEDDIYFHKDFWDIVNNLPDDLTKNYDIIYLGYNQQKFSDEQYLALDTNQLLIPMSKKYTTYGTFGILYTCKAVSILRDYFEELYSPVNQMVVNFTTIDYALWKAITHKLNLKACILNPPLVIPEVRDSTIRNSRRMEIFYAAKYMDFKDYKDVDLYEKFI